MVTQITHAAVTTHLNLYTSQQAAPDLTCPEVSIAGMKDKASVWHVCLALPGKIALP